MFEFMKGLLKKTPSSSQQQQQQRQHKPAMDEDYKHPLVSEEFGYRYSRRLCVYRTEKLEISPEEKETIDKLIEESRRHYEEHNQQQQQLQKGFKSEIQRQLDALDGERPLKIVIDTDVGTDIDDVLALLTMVHMNKDDVQLLGVTTNYHPTRLRQHIARAILDAANMSHVPVYAGPSYLCGTHRQIFHHGNEGEGLGLSEAQHEDLWQPTRDESAIEFLNAVVREPQNRSRSVSVVAIGIPTNLGYVLKRHPDWDQHVAHVVIMGGGSTVTSKKVEADRMPDVLGVYSPTPESWGPQGFGSSIDTPVYELPAPDGSVRRFLREGRRPIHLFPNHNTSGDTLASVWLFESCRACPVSLIPHEITAQHWLKGRSIETLLQASSTTTASTTSTTSQSEAYPPTISDSSSPSPSPSQSSSSYPPETALCGKLLFEWLSRRHGQRGQCPHDPLTLYEAVYPRQPEEDSSEAATKESEESEFQVGRASLRYVQGTFVVHEWAAFMTFVPDPLGPHRLSVSCYDPRAWLKWLDETLVAGVPLELQTTKSDVATSRWS